MDTFSLKSLRMDWAVDLHKGSPPPKSRRGIKLQDYTCQQERYCGIHDSHNQRG